MESSSECFLLTPYSIGSPLRLILCTIDFLSLTIFSSIRFFQPIPLACQPFYHQFSLLTKLQVCWPIDLMMTSLSNFFLLSVDSNSTMNFTLQLAHQSYTSRTFPWSIGCLSNILSTTLGLIDLFVNLQFFCSISRFVFFDAHNSSDLDSSHCLLIYSITCHLFTFPLVGIPLDVLRQPSLHNLLELLSRWLLHCRFKHFQLKLSQPPYRLFF